MGKPRRSKERLRLTRLWGEAFVAERPPKKTSSFSSAKPTPIGVNKASNRRVRASWRYAQVTNARSTKYKVSNRLVHNRTPQVQTNIKLRAYQQTHDSTAKVPHGKLVNHFPPFAKGVVGGQDRFEKRIFSLGGLPPAEKVFEYKRGRRRVRLRRRVFRPRTPPVPLDKDHEGISPRLAYKGVARICVPRRYTHYKSMQGALATSSRYGSKYAFGRGSGDQLQKVHIDTRSRVGALGTHHRLRARRVKSAGLQEKSLSQGVRKDRDEKSHVRSKGSSHIRKGKIPPTRVAFPPSLHRSSFRFCEKSPRRGLGLGASAPPRPQDGGDHRELTSPRVARKKVSFTIPPQSSSRVRLSGLRVGGGGYNGKEGGARFLVSPARPTHQPEGARRSHSHDDGLRSSRGDSFVKGGQCHRILVSQKRRGASAPLQLRSQALSIVGQGTPSIDSSGARPLRRNGGGRGVKVGGESGGRGPLSRNISKDTSRVSRGEVEPRGGHVCFPPKHIATPVLCKVPTPSRDASGCFSVPLGEPQGRIRTHPMEHDPALAGTFEGQSSHSVDDFGPHVGFHMVVAPSPQAARSSLSLRETEEEVGFTNGHPGNEYAPPAGAPNLCDLIGDIFQSKGLTPDQVGRYLKINTPRLRRYQSAFGRFYDLAFAKGLGLDANLTQMSAVLLDLDSISPSQARNAYAALLCIPGMESIKYQPLLQKVKRKWNASSPRYVDFWDPMPVFMRLVHAPYPSTLEGLRTRLILVWRFLGLYRSVDLSRTYRTVCVRDNKVYVRVHRKQKQVTFERVLSLPIKGISPAHLLLDYVRQTRHLVPAKEPVLVSLRPPYKSISRNTIGRITRDALAELGVDTSMWGPHSTRGAFVKFYKSLELPSEVVAEIGQWANLEAFAKHYLRLGAADEAASKLWKFVHTASRGPWCCGDTSPTPQEPVTRGGEEEEHAKHQGHIEPALPDPLCMDAGLEPVLNVAPNSALVPFVPIASRTRSSLEGHEVPRVPSVPKASKKKRVRTKEWLKPRPKVAVKLSSGRKATRFVVDSS